MDIAKLRASVAIRRSENALKAALADLRDVVMQTKREPSLNEREAVYRQPGYHVMFCLHAKHYFHVCVQCKRTQREANDNRERFTHTHNLV